MMGKSARDVRLSIEAGLSAQGGKLWRVNEYVRLVHHHVSKRRKEARQLRVA